MRSKTRPENGGFVSQKPWFVNPRFSTRRASRAHLTPLARTHSRLTSRSPPFFFPFFKELYRLYSPQHTVSSKKIKFRYIHRCSPLGGGRGGCLVSRYCTARVPRAVVRPPSRRSDVLSRSCRRPSLRCCRPRTLTARRGMRTRWCRFRRRC